ncbi:MAG: cysteine desulfurase family protein [Candidatus Sericytochromatia bacterium]
MSHTQRPIYLDYHATTPLDERVLDHMLPWLRESFGNPSSTHAYGAEAALAVRTAALQVAELVGAQLRPGVHHPVIWTSGATESINLALKGFVERHQPADRPFRLATMPVEHKAVLDSCRALEAQGLVEMVWLKVNHSAQLDLADLAQRCAEGLDLIAVMAANNEVGTLYPLKAVARLAQDHGVPVFCDASQAAGKVPLDFEGWGLTLLALTGHKLYGPKGAGALVVRRGTPLACQIHGGGHQLGLRSGTLNVPGIVGLGAACALRQAEMQEDEARIATLRDGLQGHLQAALPQLCVNGDLQQRLAGNLHISLPGLPNDALLAHLQGRLALSTTSACSSGSEASSHVLAAMQLPDARVRSALRLSLGRCTTPAEAEVAATLLIAACQALQAKLTD